MIARFLYRVVAVVFFLVAMFCWATGLACIVAQLSGFHPEYIPMALWAVLFAFLASMCSSEAWRAGRYDPLYD